jgi:hypothetical protein
MIVEYYMRAALAEAAYANLEGVTVADDLSSALQRIGEKPGEPDDPNKGFSLSQAKDFASHWRVAHHLPNTNTGFSATVFESIDNPGEYVFAMRGTETALDTVIDDAILADIADIGADGIMGIWVSTSSCSMLLWNLTSNEDSVMPYFEDIVKYDGGGNAGHDYACWEQV